MRLRDRTLLPTGLHAPAAAVAVVAATVVALLALRYAGDHAPGRLDGHLDRAVDALPGSEHGVARAVTVFGSPEIVAMAAVAVALVCLLARSGRGAVLAVAGPGLTGLATTVGKPLVDRTIGHHEDLAFPSGHTGGATSLALVVALLLAASLRLGAGRTAALGSGCAVLAGGAVGTGMVLSDAHYPTDVVGGFCTALAAVLAVVLALDVTPNLRPRLTREHPRSESLTRQRVASKGTRAEQSGQAKARTSAGARPGEHRQPFGSLRGCCSRVALLRRHRSRATRPPSPAPRPGRGPCTGEC